MPPSPAIPNFFLYGEHHRESLPGLVHIEAIAARSQQHDWAIKPHRHGRLYQLLFLLEGSMQVELEGENKKLNGSWAVSIPPGHVHGFRFPADTKGIVLTVSMSLFKTEQAETAHNGFDTLLSSPHCIAFEANSRLLLHLTQQFDLIAEELQRMNAGYNMMLNWSVKMVLMNLMRQLDRYDRHSHPTQGLRKQSFQQFRDLLEQHYREHWGVKEYAGQLNIAPATLNRLCKQHMGITAKEAIKDRVLLEIKRRLIYTASSHENIAVTLGFKDPSYFSRFFKHNAGVSPLAYRRQKYAEIGTSI